MPTDSESENSKNDKSQARRNEAEAIRKALIDRLDREQAPELADRLRKCNQDLPMTCTHCGGVHTVKTHCMARWCPTCQPLVSGKRIARWKSAIAKLEWPLFVTLTIPNSEDPERLRFLRDCWGKFRRRKIIKDRVSGGVATFEITNKGNGWHPHLHAVMDCEWLAIHTPRPRLNAEAGEWAEAGKRARAELGAFWADQIGEPFASVHVRRVYGDSVVLEILKYAAKGSELLESTDPIAPMIEVLRRTRTLSGWGKLHPLPSPDQDEGPSCGCEQCGVIGSFIPSEIASRFGIVSSEKTAGRTVQPRNQK